LSYEPGDALGVWAWNDTELVSRILRQFGIDPAGQVEDNGRRRSVRDTLTRHREITRLSKEFLDRYAELENLRGKGGLLRTTRWMDAKRSRHFLEARQLIDLAVSYPMALSGQELVDMLPRLASRSYSIASSAAAVEHEVHLTVATLRSNAIGAERLGVASQFLNHKVHAGDEIGVFLEHNRRFRIPEDESSPLIMIGAGTGIAPYRAFMQEIEESGRRPETWLIFGNPNRRSDFLYQREWLKWRQQGLLTRLDLAFSRDQIEKRYVQHLLAEQGDQFDHWIQEGAHVYLCGSLAMGEAVEHAMIEAFAAARGLERDAATEVLRSLRRERRLHKDLY